MRFHWYRDLNTKRLRRCASREPLRLSAISIPAWGVLREHLPGQFPVEVEEILRSLYVDDLISGGATVQKA